MTSSGASGMKRAAVALLAIVGLGSPQCAPADVQRFTDAGLAAKTIAILPASIAALAPDGEFSTGQPARSWSRSMAWRSSPAADRNRYGKADPSWYPVADRTTATPRAPSRASR